MHAVLVVIGALWMLFEDWVWDSILALMQVVARLKAIRRFEAYLQRQNPYLLLSLFLFPFLIMLPAKIWGLYLIADGKVLRGALIFAVAKVTITALVTRLFVISRDKLLLIRSFAVFYHWFREKKEWLYGELNKMPAWRTAREGIERFRRGLKRYMHRPRKG